jgi:glycosyltransferase involved in cell wall biosynthesis
MKKYILIGAVPTTSVQSYGGTTVLMDQMLSYFHESNKEYVHIQTNRYGHKFAFLFNFFWVISLLFRHIRHTDLVIVNVARNGAFIFSPVVFVIAKLFRKKFVFRMFGGNFISLYNGNRLRKLISNLTFLKADALFAETKEIVKFLREKNSNTFWFPNTRMQKKYPGSTCKFTKKFVFISSVKQTKGIDEIISASNYFDTTYTFDIYGPIQDERYKESFFTQHNVSYKGVLKPDNVLETLSEYDVLLLPTYHPGEGYPGVIIEAYSLGIPCITTDWQAIPEMVENGISGILIKPQSAKELINAIAQLDSKTYTILSNGALVMFEDFRYEKVYETVVNICEGI